MFPYSALIEYANACDKGSTFGTNIHQQVSTILSLNEEMDRLGLLDCWSFTNLIVSSSEVGLHGDGDPRYSYTLVFPVWNTENTTTEFYEPLEPPTTVVLEQEGSKFNIDGYDINKCRLIDSVEILTPTIINNDTPHRVIHKPGSPPRMTAALRLYHKEQVERVLERLND